MKPVFVFVLMFAIAVACSAPKNAQKASDASEEQNVAEPMEYGVETYNKRFDQWYQKYQDPSKYKSQAYYESWNEQYVSAWNAKCARGGNDWHFDPVVGYKRSEDYGFEMNHKLFYYFMYVENVLKIQILPGGPKDYKP